MSEPTADQLTAAISAALKARDLEAAVALLGRLAIVDPYLAQDIWEIFRAVSQSPASL